MRVCNKGQSPDKLLLNQFNTTKPHDDNVQRLEVSLASKKCGCGQDDNSCFITGKVLSHSYMGHNGNKLMGRKWRRRRTRHNSINLSSCEEEGRREISTCGNTILLGGISICGKIGLALQAQKSINHTFSVLS